MKTAFDIKQFLTENREEVICKFNKLTAEALYDGITLKAFMNEVLNTCIINRFRSAKQAKKQLPFILGNIYVEHCSVYCVNNLDAKRAAQAPNGQYLAII